MTDIDYDANSDAELAALRVIAEAYDQLDADARQRVTHYMFSRFVSAEPIEHDHAWALSVLAEHVIYREATLPESANELPRGQIGTELRDEIADLCDARAPTRAEYREALALIQAEQPNDGEAGGR